MQTRHWIPLAPNSPRFPGGHVIDFIEGDSGTAAVIVSQSGELHRCNLVSLDLKANLQVLPEFSLTPKSDECVGCVAPERPDGYRSPSCPQHGRG